MVLLLVVRPTPSSCCCSRSDTRRACPSSSCPRVDLLLPVIAVDAVLRVRAETRVAVRPEPDAARRDGRADRPPGRGASASWAPCSRPCWPRRSPRPSAWSGSRGLMRPAALRGLLPWRGPGARSSRPRRSPRPWRRCGAEWSSTPRPSCSLVADRAPSTARAYLACAAVALGALAESERTAIRGPDRARGPRGRARPDMCRRTDRHVRNRGNPEPRRRPVSSTSCAR